MLARAKISGAPGTIACREYNYHLPDGTDAVFAVTLCKLASASERAQVARQTGALAHGLFSVVGVPRAPSRPVMWMHMKSELLTVVAEDDADASDDLHRIGPDTEDILQERARRSAGARRPTAEGQDGTRLRPWTGGASLSGLAIQSSFGRHQPSRISSSKESTAPPSSGLANSR